jgi:hypothetical protein
MSTRRSSQRAGHFLAVGFIVLGIALLIGSSSIPQVAAVGITGSHRTDALSESARTETSYPVVFTESGLPYGTNWSVTLNGSLENSTTTTISFSEPNGGYLYIVGSVPGFSTAPEGNVTVSAGPVNQPVQFLSTNPTPFGCTSFALGDLNIALRGNCLGFFEADYHMFNATTGSVFDNTTFTVGPLAEVTPSGTIAAWADFGSIGSGEETVTWTANEVNLTDLIVSNVTTAIGLNSSTGNPNGETPQWNPIELPGEGGSTIWGQGSQVLGQTTVQIVFHFDNVTGSGTNRMKFDVKVSGWPWVSSQDTLGLAVETGAYALPVGSHLVYTASNDTITQAWDSNDTTISSLAFGPSANVTSSPPSVLGVTDQVRIVPPGSNVTFAGALLTFTGAGGYSNMTYDPLIEFGPHGAVPTQPLPTVPGATGPLSLPILEIIVGAAGVGLVLGIVAQRARRHPIEEGLAKLR